jgi:hypothetical protein
MALTDKDKRTLKIGGVIVGVLLVGFLLFNLLGGGGGETPVPRATRTTSSVPPVTDTGSPTLTPSPVLVLPARDPFSIPPGFGATATTTGGTTTTSDGTTTTTSSTPGGGGGSTTQTSSPGGGGGGGGDATETIGGNSVTLIDTFTTNGVETAQVDVDGTVYDPAVGDSFGPNKQYRLQSVSGNCATFLYGDESFTLCVAQNK